MKAILSSVLLFSLAAGLRAEEAATPKPPEMTAPEAKSAPAEAAVVSEQKAEPLPASVPVAAPAEVKSAEPAKPLGFWAPLKDLASFHEKELAIVNKMIERWDAKAGVTLKRRQGLEDEILTMLNKIDELKKTNTKASKNEADRLKKQISRTNKDIASVNKELKAQSKELAAEIKEVSQETQQALKDAYQQVALDVQKL